jgi:hypothetical protein
VAALNILRKDLRITKIFWGPAVFSYAVFMLVFFENTAAFAAAGIGLAFTVNVLILTLDDRARAEVLFAALPGTRASIVAGRYLAWGFVGAVGLLLFLGSTAALLAGLGAKARHLAPLLSARGAALNAAGAALAGIVFLPLFFRFGLGRGLWIFWAGIVALTVIFALASPLVVPGVRSSAGAGLLSQTPTGLFGRPFEAFGRAALAAGRSLGRPAPAMLFLAGLAALAVLSLRLSVRAYQRRDL